MKVLTIFTIVFLSITSVAKETDENFNLLKSIFTRYWQAESVFVDVSKKSVIGLLQKETPVQKGKLLFAKGNLRIDIVTPENLSVVFNDKKIITIKKLKQNGNVKTYVTIVDRKKASNENSLMGLLFGDEMVWQQLKLVNKMKKNDLTSLHFIPKNPKKLQSIQKVAIVIDTLSKEIKAIKQWDDLENEVQFIFSTALFDIKFPKETFSPSWPTTSEVTNI